MAVLIDSSVWIAAANARNKECLALKRLIETNELIYVSRPIQMEVCQGARTELEFHRLWEAFLGFDFLEIETRHWGSSAWNYYRCRKNGKTISTIDCLIATLSAEYGVPLWSLDKNLRATREIIGFDLYPGSQRGQVSL